jgi:predicted nucleic acid-binding protein
LSSAFFDSNLILYLLSPDAEKAERSEALIVAGGHVSVQVLAEVTSVCRRKFAMKWAQIGDVRALLLRHCTVHPLTLDVQEEAFAIAQASGYTIYDSQIIASALDCGAAILWSEDMQDGQRFQRPVKHGAGDLVIRNPF